MITHYPFENLGGANHGWLKTRHHFSFAEYYNPARMGFGNLRVVNDDWVEPGTGFPPHPHRDMEIISFIRTGAITHQDSEGNQGVTKAGEVQVMSAGTGIVHSEYNLTDEPLVFYQIWIKTKQRNLLPRWESKSFRCENSSGLDLLVSGNPKDKEALFINQDAQIYGGKLLKGESIDHLINNQAYILASDGEFEIEDDSTSVSMKKGDGAEVTKAKSIKLKALVDSEIIVIDV